MDADEQYRAGKIDHAIEQLERISAHQQRQIDEHKKESRAVLDEHKKDNDTEHDNMKAEITLQKIKFAMLLGAIIFMQFLFNTPNLKTLFFGGE